MTDDVCSRCGYKPREGCVNGFVSIDDAKNSARLCRNMAIRNHMEVAKIRLGPEIFEAKKIMESPLFTPRAVTNSKDPPKVDLTKEHLHIQGITWKGLLPHLKLVFLCNSQLKFKVVDDVRLKDVYLGGESAKNRSQRDKEAKENNNIIADIVGKEYDLVIVRLGHMGYKNIAAPGVLKEALMHRVETLGKATWLFETSDPTITWKHSRDEDVAYYISQKFKVVELNSDDRTPDREDIGDDEFDAEIPTEQMGLVKQRPDQQESDIEDVLGMPGDDDRPNKSYQDDDDGLLGMPGGGNRPKKKYRRSR